MSKPTDKQCAFVIEHEEKGKSIRACRVGVGPLVQVWVHQDGNGGRGIILDVTQTEDLIEGLNDLLDEIEGPEAESQSNTIRPVLTEGQT